MFFETHNNQYFNNRICKIIERNILYLFFKISFNKVHENVTYFEMLDDWDWAKRTKQAQA